MIGSSTQKDAARQSDYCYKRLIFALRTKFKRSGRKRTRRQAMKDLDAILGDDEPINVIWLHRWIQHLLTVRKIKVSSAHRYASEIGAEFLIEGHGKDFSRYSAEGFQKFYHLLLKPDHKRQSNQYKAGRLDDLHEFGVEHLNFPTLPEPLSDGRSSRMIRATVLPEPLFKTLNSLVDDLQNIDKASKASLKLLLTVAYRLGLRFQDVLTIRVGDIVGDTSIWLRCSDNEYANTKSSSFQVPVSALLLPEERPLFHEHVAQQRTLRKRKDLLFHPSGSPTTVFSSSMIMSIFHRLNSLDANFDYSFHSFRHTCLSRLQLVIENASELIEVFTPFNPEHVREIRLALLHQTEAGAHDYWCLAAFVGHATPETTFAYYLHHSDLLLHRAINEAPASLNDTQLRNLSGKSTREFARMLA